MKERFKTLLLKVEFGEDDSLSDEKQEMEAIKDDLIELMSVKYGKDVADYIQIVDAQ